MMIQAHRPPAELLLQLGRAHDPVIGLIFAPDLILRLPVSGGEKEDNFS
jgi:hypothetical protein